MGRRPNAIISEFFERGQKLENSSNRYEHTCKLCNQRFPKGRLDGLTNHLLKKCLSLSSSDRARVLRELSEKPNQYGTYNTTAISIRQEQTGDLSFLPPDAAPEVVQALVKASATPPRVGSESPQDNPRKRKRGGRSSAAQRKYESAFQVQMKSPHGTQIARLQERASPSTEEQLLHDLQRLADEQNASNEISGNVDDAAIAQDAFSAHLALAASAANNMIPGSDQVSTEEADGTRTTATDGANQGVIDPELHGKWRTSKSHKSQRSFVFHEVRPGAGFRRPRAMYTDTSNVRKYELEPNFRGKFSDDRKKEVQEVRKYGACIRCRMLKKPCSEGTPCSTCANVEQARHWKLPCMRARMEDEFDLFESNLHFLTALNALNVARDTGSLSKSSSLVEATHFPDTDIPPATFYSVVGQVGSEIVGMLSSDAAPSEETHIDIEFLDHEYVKIGDTLASYLDKATQAYCKSESSTFMRETLLMSQEVLGQRPDTLLTAAVDLWVAVHVLCDRDAAWDLQSVVINEAAIDQVEDGTESRKDHSPQNYIHSRRLVTLQLRSLIEKRATSICKTLMHDLEKRLIQRQRLQSHQFETFLTAIVLMNCVEKTCWLFNTWALQVSDGSKKSLWPLDLPPAEFVERGERVADMLAMLMKMREIPPPMTVDEDGFLHPDLDTKYSNSTRFGTYGFKGSIESSGNQANPEEGRSRTEDQSGRLLERRSIDVLTDNQDTASGDALDEELIKHLQQAAEEAAGGVDDYEQDEQERDSQHQPPVVIWFQRVNLKVEHLQRARFAAPWDEADSRCWELKYIGRMLLPDNAYPLEEVDGEM